MNTIKIKVINNNASDISRWLIENCHYNKVVYSDNSVVSSEWSWILEKENRVFYWVITFKDNNKATEFKLIFL